MSRNYIVLFSLFLSTRFMNIRGLENLPYDLLDFILICYFFIYSVHKYNMRTVRSFKTLVRFIILFSIAFVFSTVTAWIDWKQNFIVSLVVSRNLLWLSFGIYLINARIRPRVLLETFSTFGWIYIFLSLIVIVNPSLKGKLIYIEASKLYKIEEYIFVGLVYLLIPLYFNFYRLVSTQNISILKLLQIVLTVYVILRAESRATLFSVLLLILLASIIYSNGSVAKKFLVVVPLLTLPFLFIGTKVSPFIEETVEQLSDDEYPRIRGLVFFSSSFSKSNLGYFFGNSVGSKKVEYGRYMTKLKEKYGLYISDLGLFGTWVYFGVISLLAIFSPMLEILGSSSHFRPIKLLVLHMILGWTYFLFFEPLTIVFYISIIYLYDYMSGQKNMILYNAHD